MTDEEKQAIKILKDREYDFDELYCTFRQSFIKPYDKSIGIILNLIEKQQKEIEEVKAEKEKYERIVKRALMYLDYIDNDTLKMCTRYDVNGIDILKILKGG